MFTGLIRKVGRLGGLNRTAEGGVLRVALDEPWDEPPAKGESVAVSGACLTVVESSRNGFVCDVLAETLDKTNLGGKTTGAPLNLERALRMGDRLGGHMVSGHVDGTGPLVARTDTGRDWVLEIGCGADLLPEIVRKGSIAVDGVSLTVAALKPHAFTVHIIPFTWQHTALHALKPGESVNIETDIIGKYVRRCLAGREEQPGVTLDDLRRAGFLE
ncbi:MAG: riboflavin synthase [Kiritimatiellae bacterium]|nr:riboflavin synthase [Kiritimatiellia bacterium]